jgi:hypothetical protein
MHCPRLVGAVVGFALPRQRRTGSEIWRATVKPAAAVAGTPAMTGGTLGTSFNVSNNAKMEVNEFVYDPNGHSNSSLMSLTKGTFTFIAGNVAHTGDMKVDTPVGTMGIRGTAPRVKILDDGTVKFSTLVEQKK